MKRVRDDGYTEGQQATTLSNNNNNRNHLTHACFNGKTEVFRQQPSSNYPGYQQRPVRPPWGPTPKNQHQHNSNNNAQNHQQHCSQGGQRESSSTATTAQSSFLAAHKRIVHGSEWGLPRHIVNKPNFQKKSRLSMDIYQEEGLQQQQQQQYYDNNNNNNNNNVFAETMIHQDIGMNIMENTLPSSTTTSATASVTTSENSFNDRNDNDYTPDDTTMMML